METSGTNQYGLKLSSLSTSSNYQKWTVKISNAANGGFNIINGGYTTRYLARTGTAIYAGNYIEGYKSTTQTTAYSAYLTQMANSTNVFIKNSSGTWSLEINYSGDTSPQFYENKFEGDADWPLNQWKLEPV